MSVKNTTATTKTHSMVEPLEGRQLFSAAPAPAGDAALAASAGKVSMQDFHFVMKANKSSPELAAGKVTTNDISITRTMDKPTPKLFSGGDDEAAGISFVSKPTKHTPGLRVVFSDVLV